MTDVAAVANKMIRSKKLTTNKKSSADSSPQIGEDPDMRQKLFQDKRFSLFENAVISYPKEYRTALARAAPPAIDTIKTCPTALSHSQSQPRVIHHSLSRSLHLSSSPLCHVKNSLCSPKPSHLDRRTREKIHYQGTLKSLLLPDGWEKRQTPKLRTPIEKSFTENLKTLKNRTAAGQKDTLSRKQEAPDKPQDHITSSPELPTVPSLEPVPADKVLFDTSAFGDRLLRRTSRSLFDHRFDLLPEELLFQLAPPKPPPQPVVVTEEPTSRSGLPPPPPPEPPAPKKKIEDLAFVSFNDEVKHRKRITPQLADIFDDGKDRLTHGDISKLLKNNRDNMRWFDRMTREKSDEHKHSFTFKQQVLAHKIKTIENNCIIKYNMSLANRAFASSKDNFNPNSKLSSLTNLPPVSPKASFHHLPEELLLDKQKVVIVKRGVTISDPFANAPEAFAQIYCKLKVEERTTSLIKPPARERSKACLFKTDSGPTSATSFVMFGGLGLETFGDINSFVKNRWEETKPDELPLLSRYDHSFSNYQNKYFVVFGGSCSKARPFTTRSNDLYTFSIVHKRWDRRPWNDTMPAATSGHAAVVFGEYLIVFGGRTSDDEFNLDSYVIKLSDLDTDLGVSSIKIHLSNETNVAGLAHHCMVSVFDAEELDKTALHPFQKQKTFKATNKYGVKKALYIFGGIQGANYKASQDLFSLRIMSPTFTLKKVETLGLRPMARLGHSMHYSKKLQSLILMHGTDPQSRRFLRDLWMVNLVTMAWTCVDTMGSLELRPRGFHCSEYEDSIQRIYLVGGVNEEGYVEMNMTVYWLEQFELAAQKKTDPKERALM